jgi:hypothetical protein
VSVFRLHIRPSGGLGDPAVSFAYCLREGVLGLGWQVEPPSGAVLTWEIYERLAADAHGLGELSRVRYLHDNVKPMDLIWSRDTDGKYYLAKVARPRHGSMDSGLAWEYLDTPGGRDADIVNVVRCRILPVPKADDVPGKIVACFRPRRAIQSIADETAVLYSRLLWNQLAEAEEYSLPDLHRCDIFSFLDAETTEDVVFIYLQCQGWIVVPNSRMADTMRYEFVAIHRETQERALVQVKSGNTPLETDTWSRFPEKVFLFQAHGIYTGICASNVVPLDPQAIEEFMETHFGLMPRAVQRWIEFVRHHKQLSVGERET